GSHRNGLLNPDHPSGFVTEEQSAHFLRHAAPLDLELDAGEAVLLHNWLLHSSDTNRTTIARRAFSVCYMDANTVCRNGQPYPVIFGTGAL
ncbi:MAG: phytanoyl-CoA dioxygenase family protein, partial [Caldilineaceae bacterium]|nr:phytanoyl-CoA dioxygenase family protein [Caldilineaceae bacterium]